MSKLVANYGKNLSELKGLNDINKKLNSTEKALYKCLCVNEKEIKEFNRIVNLYENQYDRITEYRKSRIKRFVDQYTSDYIHNIINNTEGKKRISILKQNFQLMFGDIIEEKDIESFLDKVGQDKNIVENLLKLHQKFNLEKFSGLLLVVDDEDVLEYLN